MATLPIKACSRAAKRDALKFVGLLVVGVCLLCACSLQLDATTPTTFHAPFDFDGDGVTDKAVFDPATATWYIIPSGNPGSPIVRVFGAAGDVPVPGDYNGDGITDIAVFRPSTATWYLAPSNGKPPGAPWQPYSGSYSFQFGSPGDIPIPGDYNGDGTTDIAVFHPASASWYFAPSNNKPPNTNSHWLPDSGSYQAQFGTPGTIPVPGDLLSYEFRSQGGTTVASSQALKAVGDIPVPGDYDGDGETDLAVFTPSTASWYILPSSGKMGTPYCNNVPSGQMCGVQYGTPGVDIPVPGDYDGDGKTDIAVFHPATPGVTPPNAGWYSISSATGQQKAIPIYEPPGTVPVPGVYDGNHTMEAAVFDPATTTLYVFPWSGSEYSYGWNEGPSVIPLQQRMLAVPLARPVSSQVPKHYNYEPTAMIANGKERVWWCGDNPDASVPLGDTILYSEWDPISGWSSPTAKVGFNSQYPAETNAACSPTIVQLPSDGTYRMFYECVGTLDANGGVNGTANICAAESSDGENWSIWTGPLTGWVASQPGKSAPHAAYVLASPTGADGYGIGRPSAVVTGGQLFLYYYYQPIGHTSCTLPSGQVVNCPLPYGDLYLAQMNADGISFASPGNPPGALVQGIFFPVHVYGVDSSSGLQGYMAVLGNGSGSLNPTNSPAEGNYYVALQADGLSLQQSPGLQYEPLGYASSSSASTSAVVSDPYGHIQITGPATQFQLISAEGPDIWHSNIWPVYGTLAWQ